MSDSNKDKSLDSLLTDFSLGPDWARPKDQQNRPSKDGPKREYKQRKRNDDREFGNRGGSKHGGRKFSNDRHGGRNQRGRREFDREEIKPAEGVGLELLPKQEAIAAIIKEIRQVARVHSLYDVAKTLLGDRSRMQAKFKRSEKKSPFFKCNFEEAIFLTKEEALQHLLRSEWKNQFIEESSIEAEPPKGNFQAVAKCGISGEWLGPPNYHGYQTALRNLHRERFANMPFERYSAKVRTERSEEAVAEWLESTKQQTRWRLISAESPQHETEEESWMTNRQELERAVMAEVFTKAFTENHEVTVSSNILARNLSPGLLKRLQGTSNHHKKHPAIIIPPICKLLEVEKMPVFKRKGKLFTGPARPSGLAADAVLAPRPAEMVSWIRENKPCKLDGLWKAVLPEGATAPPAEYAADLFWLLQQGHILLYTDDSLVLQEVSEHKATKKKATKDEKSPDLTPSQTETSPNPIPVESTEQTNPSTPEPEA